MEEETANTKPSLQQSAYTRAYAAAEPGPNDHAFGEAFRTNHAIRDLTNLQPLPFAQNKFASHVDYDPYSSAHCSIAASGNYTYANPWITTRPQNHAFAPLVDPSPSQLAENTFPAGAAYNDGIAFPKGPGHYIWVPAVAARPMDQYADTNFQSLDPSFSTTRPYTPGIIGNGHGGPLQTKGFNTHTSAAGAFSNATYAGNNGNSFGGQYAANGFGTEMSAVGAFPNALGAVNGYGGQFTVNGLGAQAMTSAELPKAFDSVNNVNNYGVEYATNDLSPQVTTATGLPNAFNVVDDNATHLGPAQVAPARHTCPECNRPFKRKGDLDRHAKMHQPDSKIFRCLVAGCEYSSYRKDKLDDHVKHRHAVTASAST